MDIKSRTTKRTMITHTELQLQGGIYDCRLRLNRRLRDTGSMLLAENNNIIDFKPYLLLLIVINIDDHIIPRLTCNRG